MSTTATEQTALYVPGADDGSTQWVARTMAMINWGGFHGHHAFDFDPKSTLLTGGSGTGKSTIMDAYLALMMSSDIPFNGASNEARGRARSPERRNLLSYLRGQYGATADAEGRTKAQVLRGAHKATWGAIAVTFASAEGSRFFTALRVYYVPTTATAAEQVTMRMVTVPGQVHLPALEALVESRFKPSEIRNLFTDARTHETYQSFVNALESTLGIGSNGNGEKALRMLVRVQSSAQLPDVDSLFKQTVLDTPKTFEHADDALRAFDVLDDSYELMLREQERAELLAPIREHRATCDNAAAAMAAHTHARFGDPHGPAALWAAQVRYDALDAASDANAAARTRAAAAHAAAATALADAKADLAAATAGYNAAGGQQLVALTARIAELGGRVREREGRLDRLAPALETTQTTLDSRTSLEAVPDTAARALAGAETDKAALDDEQLTARVGLGTAQERMAEATRDLDSFRGRAGRIEREDHERRCAVAAAVGLDPADLPFIAELIDIPDSETGWRPAIETVLAGEVRTVVVDQSMKAQFSARIDQMQLRGRIRFVFADPDQHPPAAQSSNTIAGKLVYKDGPWNGWVRTNMAKRAHNATCVETAGELTDNGGLMVTRAGQTRNLQRGAHGTNRGRHVIGFTNEAAVAAAEAELKAATAERDQRLAEVDQVRSKLRDLERVRAAWQTLADLDVDDHDVFTTREQLRTAQDERTRLETSDDRLAALKAKLDTADGVHDQALREEVRLGDELTKLKATHEQLVDQQDEVSRTVDSLEQSGVEVDDDLRTRLETGLARAAHPHDPRAAEQLQALNATLERLYQALNDQVAVHQEAAGRSAAAIVGIFRQYQQRWNDPNLDETLDSYDDFLAILDLIQTSGLAEQRKRWRDEVLKWSGDALVPLNQTMEDAIDDIQDRLDPVNDVLAQLPFGARGDRLRMDMRRLTPVAVSAFRRELKEISGVATAGLSEEQLIARFVSLRTFMAKLRTKDDPRAPREGTDRDRLLDVRRQVEIKAEQVTTTGEHVAYHASLATYSGGETQEVGAFIAGAALRYRLGDDGQRRPRFAPVLIDEAFIKADGEFTRRAVHAWQALGFQLIIGCPTEKFAGVEKAMNRIISVDKDLATNLSYPYVLRDAPEAAA